MVRPWVMPPAPCFPKENTVLNAPVQNLTHAYGALRKKPVLLRTATVGPRHHGPTMSVTIDTFKTFALCSLEYFALALYGLVSKKPYIHLPMAKAVMSQCVGRAANARSSSLAQLFVSLSNWNQRLNTVESGLASRLAGRKAMHMAGSEPLHWGSSEIQRLVHSLRRAEYRRTQGFADMAVYGVLPR